ncbi:D-2-hydroxyacid dehydrogenase family protein [Mucilaginibacter phyllosphaerae]
MKIAVLDDYQNIALNMADWTEVTKMAGVDVFQDHISDQQQLLTRLVPYDVICVMRERTPLTAAIMRQLPNLKLIVSTGFRNASIDMMAAKELGIEVKNTGYFDHGASEMTWAMLMAMARNIPAEVQNVKNGGWQTTIGTDLRGKTIGIVGLGGIGSKIAAYARAFGMNVIAWSQNLTAETADGAGAQLVTKEKLFREADFITLHLVLSERSVGTVSKHELALMKPTAYIINTSRGPLINEHDLIQTLTDRKIAGAAIDVFETEPLPADHPFRTLDNIMATPHIGYITQDTYTLFFKDMVAALEHWLRQQ